MRNFEAFLTDTQNNVSGDVYVTKEQMIAILDNMLDFPYDLKFVYNRDEYKVKGEDWVRITCGGFSILIQEGSDYVIRYQAFEKRVLNMLDVTLEFEEFKKQVIALMT